MYLFFGKDKDVACSQVAVYQSSLLQVRHSVGDLERQLTQQVDAERVTQQLVLQTIKQRSHRCQLCHLNRSVNTP